MSNHRQHYKPQQASEPHPMLFVAGLFFTVGGIWLLAAFLFSL